MGRSSFAVPWVCQVSYKRASRCNTAILRTRRFKEIGEELLLAPDKHAPLFEKTAGGQV